MFSKTAMKTSVCLALLLAALAAQARTWTSTAGATLDAEYVETINNYVVLQRPDGGRVKIWREHLSQNDREHIDSLATGAGEKKLSEEEIGALFGVKKDEAAEQHKPATDGKAQAKTGKVGSLLDPVNIAAPVELAVDDFATPRFRPNEATRYLGVQYGPASNDVVYVAFEIEKSGETPAAAHVRDLGSVRIASPVQIVRGRNSTVQLGRSEFRTASFRDISVQTSFAEHSLTAEIEIYFGLGGDSSLYVLADITVQDPARRTSEFQLFGPLASSAAAAGGKVRAQSLYGKPSISMRAAYKRIYGLVKLGELELIPGRRSAAQIVASIKDAEGETLKDYEIKLDSDRFFELKSRGQNLWCDPSELEKSGEYQIEAKLDMSPYFDPLKSETKYTVN
jgi:hypothetical protein